MKIALMLVFVMHALIHGLGFAKAFQWLSLPQLTLPISRFMGVIWLLTALALLVSGILMLADLRYWWALAGIALASSQFLIIQNWSAARYGTIVNGLLFVAALVGFGSWVFDRNWDRVRNDLLQDRPEHDARLVTDESLRTLPPPVQNWLRWSRIVGRPEIASLSMKQKGALRLKPEDKLWLPSESEQLIVTKSKAFMWKVRIRMQGLPVLGIDSFHKGKGSTWISLFGLIPIANVAGDPKTNQSALQRFLGEIVWVPSAALHPSITWKARDAGSAEATMTWDGAQGSAVFYFRPDGEPYKFVAQRFKDRSDEKPQEWVADMIASREFSGLRIPARLKATWILPSGPFTWYEFEVVEAHYDEFKTTHPSSPERETAP
jgi:hypothetical protein